MRLSARVNNDLSFGDLLAVAIGAESAGFDQLWVSNDLFLRSAPSSCVTGRRSACFLLALPTRSAP